MYRVGRCSSVVVFRDNMTKYDNDNILFSVHLSQGMIINCTHTVHIHVHVR